MVCLGNICRSPMAAVVGRAMVEEAGLGERFLVESFGTAGYHVGEAADRRAVAALRRRGWPAGDAHRARRITPDDVADCELVLCADRSNVDQVLRLVRGPRDRSHIQLLRSFDPAAPPGDDEVPDPWGGDSSDFDHTLELIEAACRGLVERLAVAVR
ncbi:MAG: low molecular weight protein-tyrosine phosphatase [Acidimicrobiaceae bacterium]|jgi:protein-tyrosine phosphatase|nr:low molecular weight protein-tyrosine phosphatase [Acidimicrobiaceae bacterium]